MCHLSKPASFSFVFSNRLRQSFVISHKAQKPPFPNTTAGKSKESLHELSGTRPPLKAQQTAPTSLRSRKVVQAGKGREAQVKSLARLLYACWWHPRPQTQPSSCREPLTPAGFHTASHPGHQQLHGRRRQLCDLSLVPGKSLPLFSICHTLTPWLTGWALLPSHIRASQPKHCYYCSQCPSNTFGEATGLLSYCFWIFANLDVSYTQWVLFETERKKAFIFYLSWFHKTLESPCSKTISKHWPVMPIP